MNILVTGGAGYIGTHAVRRLLRDGHTVLIVDDFRHGHVAMLRAACADHGARAYLLAEDMGRTPAIAWAIDTYAIDAVMHFAADIEVGESVTDPLKYYANNFANSLALLRAVVAGGVRRFIFSSTAAVYGIPQRVPISEHAPCAPVNPYGRSKMMFEMALQDAAAAHGLGHAILRYFNVAGASPDAAIGECHVPETHLIPRVLTAAADDAVVSIYGDDYETPDGTCIRDYVHVEDLVDAHVLALNALKPGGAAIYNIGSERGFSVKEVIATCSAVTGRRIRTRTEPRRAGDPAMLVASSEAARAQLGWSPRHAGLEDIVAHAWAWHSRRRDGLGAAAVGDDSVSLRDAQMHRLHRYPFGPMLNLPLGA